VQAERIFGKTEFENLYVNISRNSIFLIGQIHWTIYMKRVRFTILTAMRSSEITRLLNIGLP